MSSGPIAREPTKQERVYAASKERILSGTWGPGYRVVIDALALEFGVSAQPVREAVRRLEAEGLIIYRPNAGAQVAPAEPIVFGEEMEVLAVLEGYATGQAAPLLTREDLEQLCSINAEMRTAMESMDPLAFGRLNQEFHETIIVRCPNPALVVLIREVVRRLDAIRRTVFVQIPYRGAKSIAEHQELIDLLTNGASFVSIEAAARAHKLQTIASFDSWRAEQAPAS